MRKQRQFVDNRGFNDILNIILLHGYISTPKWALREIRINSGAPLNPVRFE
jgi:hypothetical protein